MRIQRKLHSSFATRLLLLLLLVVASGCSSFNREWKKAGAQPVATNELTGRWQGVWVSEATGHTDQLRCIVTCKEDGAYHARFHAKYHTILSFGYTVPLQVERTNDVFQFQGEADLGWMAGGLYQYAGHADAINFFSTYSSKDDHGTFRMTRPEPAGR
jgi:hypothetical protein